MQSRQAPALTNTRQDARSSPHVRAPMLMRGNALLLKTPVENAPRTSIEKHLSWSSDIPPTSLFPLHRSRPAEYQPNRQPATVCTERGTGEARQRVGRRRGLLTSGARQSLCVLVIQYSAPDRGQHLTVPILGHCNYVDHNDSKNRNR